jgi:hypothetical protein
MKLLYVSNMDKPLVVKKWQFPPTPPIVPIVINGKSCQACQTTGRHAGERYTYFMWEGESYYVKGHISDIGVTLTLKGMP